MVRDALALVVSLMGLAAKVNAEIRVLRHLHLQRPQG